MATHTLDIPQQTLKVGQTILGPVSVGNNTVADVRINRALPGGLNSLTETSTLAAQVQWFDGTSWHDIGGLVWSGGVVVSDRTGQQQDISFLTVGGVDPSATRVQVVVVVGGPVPIVIAGTVTVS